MKRFLIKILKWTGLLILIPVALFLLLQTWFYLTAPVYRFATPQPFRGTLWYNPYAGMDSACWRRDRAARGTAASASRRTQTIA